MLRKKAVHGCDNWESPLAHGKIAVTVREHHGMPHAYKDLECPFKDIFEDQGSLVTLLCFPQFNQNKSSSKNIIFLCSFHSKANLTLNNNPSC